MSRQAAKVEEAKEEVRTRLVAPKELLRQLSYNCRALDHTIVPHTIVSYNWIIQLSSIGIIIQLSTYHTIIPKTHSVQLSSIGRRRLDA